MVGIVAATGISFSMSRWLVFARRPDQKRTGHFPARAADRSADTACPDPTDPGSFADRSRFGMNRSKATPAAISAIAGTIGARIRRSVQKKPWTSVRPIATRGAAIRGQRQRPGCTEPETDCDPERDRPGHGRPARRGRSRPRRPGPRSRNARAAPASHGRNRPGVLEPGPRPALSSSDRPAGSDMPVVARLTESHQSHWSWPVQTRPGGPFKTSS